LTTHNNSIKDFADITYNIFKLLENISINFDSFAITVLKKIEVGDKIIFVSLCITIKVSNKSAI